MFAVWRSRCSQEEKKSISAVITWLHCSCRLEGLTRASFVKYLGSSLHSQNGYLLETLHNTDSQKSICKPEIWDCFASLRQLSCSEMSAINSGSLVHLCILSHCVEEEKLDSLISMGVWSGESLAS